MSVLLLYLGITVVGYFLGAFLKKKNISLKGIGVSQTIAIVILVFVMGSKIGSDKEIVSSLDTIGLISLAATLFIMAGSAAAVFAARKFLGFDREGMLRRCRKADDGAAGYDACAGGITVKAGQADSKPGSSAGEAPEEKTSGSGGMVNEPEEAKPEEAKADYSMTLFIVCAVGAGIIAGRFFLPGGFLAAADTLIVIGLCLLLFFVGLDIGTAGTIVENFRQAGWRVFVFPFMIIIGTLAGAALSSLFLPVGLKEALCVGSGLGWYSLAPVMLADYSVKVSAISFMHNVMRELFGILLIPLVARKIGYIEAFALPGSPCMDVCLPIIEKATKADIAVYSFISGVILSVAVPVLVSFFMGI